MTDDPAAPDLGRRFPLGAALAGLLGCRAAAGVALVLVLLPVCIDDHFRVFHAAWWWEHPSFTSSHEWLPGFLYVYGPLVGLTGDTVLAPRLLTLALHLAGVALLAAAGNASRGARWLAAIWLAASPLALVLGTVPLTESLALVAVLGSVLGLGRWHAGGHLPALLLAAACSLLSAMLRYELWVFLPLFTALALARRPRGGAAVARALALLPWFFPLVWTAMLWALEGTPLSFLRIVDEDHFGAGSLVAALSSPFAAVLAVQAAAGILAAALGFAAGIRGRRPVGELIWECHALLAAALLAGLVIAGEVPSQYPERLLLWVTALSAIPVGRLADRRLGGGAGRRLVAGAALGGLLLALGAAYALGLPLGIPRGDFEAGLAVRESFARGHLAPDAHVVIEHALPESTAPFVYANRPGNVHIDALGTGCPERLLGGVEPFCPLPDWTPAVRLVLAREAATVEALRAAGWSVRDRIGEWTFVLRVPGASPLPLVGAPAVP